MTLDAVETAAAKAHLAVLGALHPDGSDEIEAGTLVLLGPREPGFWAHVTDTPEFADGRANPLDRWSARVIGALAETLGAQALFPFGGPPWHPFIGWAVRSGRAWPSPVSLLVHDTAGLMLSYRGALAFDRRMDLPATPPRPCDSCADQPCRGACPVSALTADAYDVPVCRGYLETPGNDCLTGGCAARRACPVSQSYGRHPEQSGFHMRAFQS